MNSNAQVEDSRNSSTDKNGQMVKAETIEMRPARPAAPLSNQDESKLFTATNFGQSVVFQQSQVWSRAIIWGIMGITAALVAWACIARIDEAVPAQGKLEPLDDVKKVQAPISGVVKQIYVKNGDKVKVGDLLLKLESSIPESQLKYLAATKVSLEEENRFYRSQMNPGAASTNDLTKANLNIKPEVLSLTKSRNALSAENQLYKSQLTGNTSGSLTDEQRARLQSNVTELNTRLSAGKLEVSQVQKQMSENRIKRQGAVNQIEGINSIASSIRLGMVNSRNRMMTELGQIDRQLSQSQSKIQAAQNILNINQGILTDIRPAGAAGAISKVQVLRQEQEISTRAADLDQQRQEQARLRLEKERVVSAGKAEMETQQQRLQEQLQQIKQRQSEISQMDEEYVRLQLGANQGVEKLKNNVAVDRKDLFARIADNEKRIAEIDSQLNKVIVENEKKISEITNQITQANQNLKYQEIRSPAEGTVFELKAYKDGVVNTNSPEALVQVVPDNNLIAKVFITNKDIGFVTKDLPVDVRIDSFPFSEFGDVKGTLEWIGSDALPPDQTYQFYRFPARIKLAKQNLIIRQGTTNKEVQLQAGMSINANIKLRDRTVMSIFTDMFFRQSDSLKNVR